MAYQFAYLFTKFNPIYWNTANLIVNSSSQENPFEDEDESVKGRDKGNDYAKTAKALIDIIAQGVKVSLVDINHSEYGFIPDVKNNQILFGLKPLSGINQEIIDMIISNRPYKGIKDFMQKCNLKKPALVSLIKSGAFDNLENEWAAKAGINPRFAAMAYFISKSCEPKTKLNLQNFNGLIQKNLIPEELSFEKQIFYFNKHLKENKRDIYYVLTEKAFEFFSKNFSQDNLTILATGAYAIEQKKWDNIYKKIMLKARNWLIENQQEVLKRYNQILFNETWDKYASGTIAAWEMDSLCFYHSEHELKDIDMNKYGISRYDLLPEEPVVAYYFERGSKQIPIYQLTKIVGTVISKNDSKSIVNLLTPFGLTAVKFNKEYYSNYKKQIAEIQEDGTKKIAEKGWFKRGEKLLITGFRRGDQFVAKTYKNTQTHQLYKITKIDGTDLELIHERYGD